MIDLSLPGGIGFDRGGILVGVTLGVRSYMQVVRFPVVEVADEQVVGAAPGFAEGDQVARIKFELRIEMEWFNVVNLQSFSPVATDHAGRFAAEMLMRDLGPFGAAGSAIFISDPGTSVLLPGWDASISSGSALLFLAGWRTFAPGSVAARRAMSACAPRARSKMPERKYQNEKHNDD
ncbi:hypothetical protein KDH_78380 [Dictyobacter sp. S3.2.2.5]|uniref:Uncharacterized protein n=1 Tax=Dictyobacter halimunensis TaxID=3026934 RepID=A0ABQ6G3C0_9CHLR|nr:hypothetical protein KDH_78380 [Dictyobacter sp. S3.2.2.5]